MRHGRDRIHDDEWPDHRLWPLGNVSEESSLSNKKVCFSQPPFSRRDPTNQREADNGITRGRDDCRQGARPMFTFAQGEFRCLSFGDVDDGRRYHQPALGLDRIEPDFDRKLLAVLLEAVEIALSAHPTRTGSGEITLDQQFDASASVSSETAARANLLQRVLAEAGHIPLDPRTQERGHTSCAVSAARSPTFAKHVLQSLEPEPAEQSLCKTAPLATKLVGLLEGQAPLSRSKASASALTRTDVNQGARRFGGSIFKLKPGALLCSVAICASQSGIT